MTGLASFLLDGQRVNQSSLYEERRDADSLVLCGKLPSNMQLLLASVEDASRSLRMGQDGRVNGTKNGRWS